jgi:RNA polymerase sigma-70 factor, ECF subfamily
MLAMRAKTTDDGARTSATADASEEKTGRGQANGQPVDWALLVAQVKAGDDRGLESLYQLFSRGVRYYLCRQLGPEELEDRIHDTFLIVVNAIKKGDLREPERLMGFVRTIVRRQVATYIDQVVHTRREQTDLESGAAVVDRKGDPEQQAMARQKTELMKSVLESLSERDRDILVRFYLREQTQEQICQEMRLTETQFRLLKSRAKAKFGEIGKKKIANGAAIPVLLRSQAG